MNTNADDPGSILNKSDIIKEKIYTDIKRKIVMSCHKILFVIEHNITSFHKSYNTRLKMYRHHYSGIQIIQTGLIQILENSNQMLKY